MSNCIICHTALQDDSHEGVHIGRCPAGHGVWLDRGELRAIAESELQDRPENEELIELAGEGSGLREWSAAMSAEGTRPCPACQRPMTKQPYGYESAIVIDECSEHGIWLDGGELERIEAYAEGVRNRDATGGKYSRLTDDPSFIAGLRARLAKG